MAVNQTAASDATAFLVNENTVYFTRSDVVPTPKAPYTPLAALIEGIWNINPEFANKILRNHLCSFYLRTPLCDGMIKVAAKRARIMTEFESYDMTEKLANKKWVEVFADVKTQLGEFSSLIGKKISNEEALNLVHQFAKKSELKEVRSESDRPVGAILLSKENEVLSLGWNTNAKQRIHHCEVNLIRNYLLRTGKLIPADSTLVVSLKPCAMCAAQLLTFSEDFSSLRVLYLEDDPGPAATNSVLVAGSDLAKKAKAKVKQFSLIHTADEI